MLMIFYAQTIRKASVPDANGRIYPREVLLSMADNINKQPMFGELGYQTSSVVSLSNVTHQVLNAVVKKDRLPRKNKKLLKKRGKYSSWLRFHSKLLADIKMLDRPGRELLNKHAKELTIGTRGIGEVNNDVVSNYTLISADIIAFK